nr:atherin-like [Taeniopygia guttata]
MGALRCAASPSSSRLPLPGESRRGSGRAFGGVPPPHSRCLPPAPTAAGSRGGAGGVAGRFSGAHLPAAAAGFAPPRPVPSVRGRAGCARPSRLPPPAARPARPSRGPAPVRGVPAAAALRNEGMRGLEL